MGVLHWTKFVNNEEEFSNMQNVVISLAIALHIRCERHILPLNASNYI